MRAATPVDPTPEVCEHNYVDGVCSLCGESDPNYVAPDAPEAFASATYTFANYVVDGELGGGEVVRELDSNVSLTISSGWISGDTGRIYKNSNAVISSQVAMSSIVVNAGNKDSTFDVYVSADGETWTLLGNYSYVSNFCDVTIEFTEATKYVKIDAPNAQVRMKYITVNFA